MNVEANRLRTFSEWPANATVDSARMAKAGFYYNGQAQEVKCFECGIVISDWNFSDQVMARHRQAQPNCLFVLNPSDTTNIPLIQSNNPSREESADEENNIATSTLINNSLQPCRAYRSLAQRLRSFENWPVPTIVTPERLAKAGFYFLQRGDMVECAFCQGVIGKWEPGDDPDQEHRINFPNCDFYIRYNQEEELSGEKLEISNVKLMPGTTADLTELGIQTHSAPKQPKCATYEGRLRTFQDWPKHLNQTPEMLAAAGFYYAGFEDQVRCFHCDGGLRNWEATDDAWIEHARWFPKCGFVALVQGQDFIKQCMDNRPPLDPSIFAGMSEEEPPNTSEAPSTSVLTPSTSHVREVTDAELEQLLATAPAMAALQVGLHVGRVKMALKKRMEETGVPYVNEDELIEDVLRIQFYEDDNSSVSENRTLDSLSSEFTPLLNQMNNEQMPNSSRVEKDKVQMPHVSCSEQDKAEKMDSRKDDDALDDKQQIENDKKHSEDKSKETVMLEEENRRLKEARLCKICMDREVAIVFLPCGHLATCVHCAPSLTHCPMCRQDIRATVRTFLA